MTHENINFNQNGTVSTNPKHPLIWQDFLSGDRQEDDQVVMLNIAMLVCIIILSLRVFFLNDKDNNSLHVIHFLV